MKKDDLLLRIADTAYNVGFGAKKHFATYDIIEKAPTWIGFVSMSFGIFALCIDLLAKKYISATLIVLGISALHVNTYNESKLKYEEAGVILTELFNDLKSLYYAVKSSEKIDYSKEIQILKDIESKYYQTCISKQILFSDWCAHYKFFWQHQIKWIDEQKHFRFWRDKVPLSFSAFCLIVIGTSGILFYYVYAKGLL